MYDIACGDMGLLNELRQILHVFTLTLADHNANAVFVFRGSRRIIYSVPDSINYLYDYTNQGSIFSTR